MCSLRPAFCYRLCKHPIRTGRHISRHYVKQPTPQPSRKKFSLFWFFGGKNFFGLEAVLLQSRPNRTPSAPLHPFNGAGKNELRFVWWLCACGRFAPFTHSLVIRSASLRFPSLRFTPSSLLRSVRFSPLSTAHKSSSFRHSRNAIAQFRFAVRSDLHTLRVVMLRKNYNTGIPSSETGQLHSTQSNSFHSFSRYPCLCPRSIRLWCSLFSPATLLPHQTREPRNVTLNPKPTPTRTAQPSKEEIQSAQMVIQRSVAVKKCPSWFNYRNLWSEKPALQKIKKKAKLNLLARSPRTGQ